MSRINFFEREVEELKDLYNEVYGNEIITNLNTRYCVFLSILGLDLLSREIKSLSKKVLSKARISEFVMKHKKVSDFLNYLKKQKERRCLNEQRKSNNCSKTKERDLRPTAL